MASYASNSSETLILEVQKYPALYDTSCEAYKDAVKKLDLWECIGARVDMPGPQVAKKWKDIRDAFLKSRTRQKTKSGQGAKTVKPYKYNTILEFLLPYIKPRSTQSNLTESQPAAEGRGNDSQHSDDDDDVADGSNSNASSLAEATPTYKKPRRRRSSEESHRVEEGILQYLKEGRSREEDADEQFFSSMAAMCRKLPENLKPRVHFEIHRILYDALESVHIDSF